MGKLEVAGIGGGAERIVPEPTVSREEDVESLDVWGFRDSAFRVNTRGHVELTGTRYALSGHELPELLPWMRGILGADLDPRETHPSQYPPAVPPSHVKPELVEELKKLLGNDAVSDEPLLRLRHGHGHTQQEMYAIKYGGLERIPDLVVFPGRQEQVVALVEAAVAHDVCLIPFGGGTNVTEALRCPAHDKRAIVSVDMRRMNKILWIDPENHVARIEAGAVGRDIVSQLEGFGFTMGHEPDSIELSTLGGWVATHASGMKKNRYGEHRGPRARRECSHAARSALALRGGPPGIHRRRPASLDARLGGNPRHRHKCSGQALPFTRGAALRLHSVPELRRRHRLHVRADPRGLATRPAFGWSTTCSSSSVRRSNRDPRAGAHFGARRSAGT